mgnify:CR=1 FL=1
MTNPTPHPFARWYCVDSWGIATLCANEADAYKMAKECAQAFTLRGPYLVQQLVDAAGVAEEIERWRTALAYAITQADGWHDECRGGPIDDDSLMDAARALLALPNKAGD